jgi:hypothetical protein
MRIIAFLVTALLAATALCAAITSPGEAELNELGLRDDTDLEPAAANGMAPMRILPVYAWSPLLTSLSGLSKRDTRVAKVCTKKKWKTCRWVTTGFSSECRPLKSAVMSYTPAEGWACRVYNNKTCLQGFGKSKQSRYYTHPRSSFPWPVWSIRCYSVPVDPKDGQ